MKFPMKLLSICVVGGLAAGCAGGDDDPAPQAARMPQLKLTITSTEDFPGTYGSVGPTNA